MHYRTLGRTGIGISTLAFGAGPISTLMVGDDAQRQQAVVQRAIDAGINWFDTAATYGAGQSEKSLGRALEELEAADRVHVATKVRIMPEDRDLRDAIRRSVEGSLSRLRLARVTLLQLHNSITRSRGDEPTSLTPADVLGPRGVLETFLELREDGVISHLGLTGIGQPDAMREVIRSGKFETIQTPYHLVNPSAGRGMAEGWAETNYGNIIADCAQAGMGVLAIRVFAGGALLGNPPSPHTFKTPFFPLDLYRRDQERAARLEQMLGPERRLSHEAIRFALAHPHVHSALIGFGAVEEIDEAFMAITSAAPAPDWEKFLETL
jgi:aryl-alcohol dehydrogenase-like predicted oxidoreductase